MQCTSRFMSASRSRLLSHHSKKEGGKRECRFKHPAGHRIKRIKFVAFLASGAGYTSCKRSKILVSHISSHSFVFPQFDNHGYVLLLYTSIAQR